MKLWLLIIKAHRPPAAVGNSAGTGREDRQRGKRWGRLLTDGSEFHTRSASWGRWPSGPPGCPCGSRPHRSARRPHFSPSHSVLLRLPAPPICFLQAGDVPANHGGCPGEKPGAGTAERWRSANRFFPWAGVGLRGHALRRTSRQRRRLRPAEAHTSFAPPRRTRRCGHVDAVPRA